MTDCTMAEISDLLPLFAGGHLSTDEAREVEAHLSVCSECRLELSLLQTLRSDIDLQVQSIDLKAIAAAVVRETIPDGRGQLSIVRSESKRGAWFASSRPLLAAAASLIFVAIAAYAVVGGYFGDETQESRMLEIPSSLVTSASGLALAVGMDDLEQDELLMLLSALDQIEPNFDAEPVTIREAIVDAPGGNE